VTGAAPDTGSTGEHELLLIGVRGNVPAPATAMCGSVVDAPVGRHSAKPEVFAEIIEREFPNLPKIELNRRGAPAWAGEVSLRLPAG
jgi:N6-adenosine-specific RNA methylase IME4